MDVILRALVMIWLAVCAWQDWRSRKVSNTLTQPALVLAEMSSLVILVRGDWMPFVRFWLSFLVLMWVFQRGGTRGADIKVICSLSVFWPAAFYLALMTWALLGLRSRESYPALVAVAAVAWGVFLVADVLPLCVASIKDLTQTQVQFYFRRISCLH